ncbi:hypothetical protein ABIB40_001582 [Pedobacter sp. UYP30]|uniref:hypothetical protein n=1 Tax=Pedobacter sp. UYP30 TaxID=1756400 RepID=UPI003399D1FF
MKKITKALIIAVFAMMASLFCAFSNPMLLEEYLNYLQKTLVDHYDGSQEKNLIKRYELNVTNTGFCRYRRFYNSGKTEYFSFKLSKFKDIDYLGTTKQGKLILRTVGDDVILQTYNDKAGDIDSMASSVIIPMKDMEVDDLNKIKSTIIKINTELN